MAVFALGVVVAPVLGPTFGGWLTDNYSWRWTFYINIPIGIAGLIMVYLHLPNYAEEKTPPLNIVGLILFGSGIALLSYVLEVFGEGGVEGVDGFEQVSG